MKRPFLEILAILVVFLATLALSFAATANARPHPHVQAMKIRTVPAGSYLRFELAGHIYITDRNGITTVPAVYVRAVIADLHTNPLHLLRLLPNRQPDGSFFRLQRWYHRTHTRNALTAAINLYRPVRFSLVSRTGQRSIPVDVVQSLQMKSSDGAIFNLTGRRLVRSVVIRANRVRARVQNPEVVSHKLRYRILTVSIGGHNLVHHGQQFFLPSDTMAVKLHLLVFSVDFEAQDILFGFSIGSGIRLVYPNGRIQTHHFRDGVASAALPRGTYHVSAIGPGISPSQPVAVTRDHVAKLRVLSYYDIIVIVVPLVSLIVGLALLRRPALRRMLSPRPSRPEC